jgi:hypothetical protein
VENLTITPFEDGDGDGIEDNYEIVNGLDRFSPADKFGDLDGDGQNNYAEYLAGTAANDPADVLRLKTWSVMGANYLSSFPSVTGKVYQLQSSLDLQTWTGLQNIQGTGADINLTVPQASLTGQKNFLRVKVAN